MATMAAQDEEVEVIYTQALHGTKAGLPAPFPACVRLQLPIFDLWPPLCAYFDLFPWEVLDDTACKGKKSRDNLPNFKCRRNVEEQKHTCKTGWGYARLQVGTYDLFVQALSVEGCGIEERHSLLQHMPKGLLGSFGLNRRYKFSERHASIPLQHKGVSETRA